MNHDHDMMSPMGSLSCVRARYIQSLTNQENMVDTTIYFVYLPSKNLNAVGWIMHILSLIIVENFFSVQLGKKVGGKGIVNQSLI